MKNLLLNGSKLLLVAGVSAIAIANLTSPVQSQSDDATVIALTQTGCRNHQVE